MSTIKTAPGNHFHATGKASKRQRLFSVNPDVPMLDAMQSVSDLLDTMQDAIFAAAMSEQPLQDNAAWLVNHTLESAKAVIDSLIDAMQHPAGDQPAKE